MSPENLDSNSAAATGQEPQATVPTTWLMLADKLGDNGQVEAIVDALGWPVQRKTLRFLPQYQLGKPHWKPSLYHVDLAQSDALTPPWPDLVMTVGRRPSMAAMWVKRQSGGRTKLVIVGRPRRMLNDFDLVVATPQYRLPQRANVMRASLPLMRVDPVRVAAATDIWRERLHALPRPLTAVLVGGQTKPFIFDRGVAEDFLSRLEQTMAQGDGSAGTLYVTTSRRTRPDVVEALVKHLPATSVLYCWQPDAIDNPYLGLLGLADRFVVTGDSISMLVEVARLGKPLAIFPLPVEDNTRERMRRRLAEILQPEAGSGRSRPLTRIGNWLYDIGLIGYAREFREVYDRLTSGGNAVMLGEAFAPTPGAVADDAPLIAKRIRRLFASSSLS